MSELPRPVFLRFPTSAPMVNQFDSDEIRAKIASADVIHAYDPQHGLKAVFFGRELLERVARSGISADATVVKIAMDLTSDDAEHLVAIIRKVKGSSSFLPADLFPRMEIDEASFARDPDLLNPVRDAVERIRAQHRTVIPLMQRRFYYQVRSEGFTAANRCLTEATHQTNMPQAYIVCLVTLGTVLYQWLPVEAIRPTRCVDVIHREGPGDRILVVRCRSLESVSTPKGTAYFSRRRPRLRFGTDSQDRIIAFSRHALEQISERTVYNWRSYGAHGDAFAFFDNCIYFEDCTAIRGEPSLEVYNSCIPHFSSWQFVSELIADPLPGARYYYHVGYCPVEFYGDVAKAITLLVPGMNLRKGTPEGRLIEQSGLPQPEIERLKERVELQKTRKEFADREDYSLVKWFHQNGVPQVISIERDVFQYD